MRQTKFVRKWLDIFSNAAFFKIKTWVIELNWAAVGGVDMEEGRKIIEEALHFFQNEVAP